jgi:Omp85 superfamily domain/WD40-like Beta Propeller Repeat
MCSGRTLASLLLLLWACGPSTATAAGRYDPTLRFRTVRTAHFDLHAHQGEEAMARRLAAIVERVRAKFEPVFGVPRGRVQVILVDQTDLSNGWATPVPYDTIEITAVPPSAESLIGNTTDWLELVFTHEYTHILHLDRSRGLFEGVRRVFGRVPLAFPNDFLPVWQVEGIATFEESRMTGEGRVPAGDFRAIVDVAAAAGRFEPIDRAAGGLIDWPAGNAAYAYGAYFHQYLADQYGAERLTRLADATAGRIPFFDAGAFKNVFDRSLTDLWQDFREAREQVGATQSETDAHAERLTHHGFTVTAPAVAGDGTIYYGVSNADGFPALMALPPGGVPRRLAWRALGNRTSVRGEWIVFDQLERVRSVALYSDLYAVRTDGDSPRRLTRAARAADPDLSPDGKRIVCTLQAIGRRALALLDFPASGLATPHLLIDDPDADFTGPRWSPDGRQIVAARRRAGAYELVLIDPATRAVRPLAARSDARLVTPSWTPDGATVLFAADPGDQPFNVFAVDVASGEVRKITDTAGGAQFPELSRSGTLTYVGYTPDGYDLFSVPVEASPSKAVDRSFPLTVAADPAATPGDSASRSYRPWRTLAPTYWTPVVVSDAGETLIGAGTAMYDALGRHNYAVDAEWAAHRTRPDWHAGYAYDRWRPTLFASYADDTDPIRDGTVRSQELFTGALLPFRHLRWTETLQSGFDVQTDTITCTTISSTCRTRQRRRDLRSLRGGWLHDSRRLFGYSISPEEGFAVETAVETSRTAFGSDADAGAAVFDIRGYQRLLGRHTVLAGRLAAAAGWGPVGARRVFSAGGAGPSPPVFDFGRDTIGLVRGIAPEDLVGTRALVANLDLRFPIARIQRGAGVWPIFFRTVHGAAFVDVGNAWDSSFHAADVRTSAGGELSLDLVILHYLPLTLVSGASWTRDPVAGRSHGALFGRIGHAF